VVLTDVFFGKVQFFLNEQFTYNLMNGFSNMSYCQILLLSDYSTLYYWFLYVYV